MRSRKDNRIFKKRRSRPTKRPILAKSRRQRGTRNYRMMKTRRMRMQASLMMLRSIINLASSHKHLWSQVKKMRMTHLLVSFWILTCRWRNFEIYTWSHYQLWSGKSSAPSRGLSQVLTACSQSTRCLCQTATNICWPERKGEWIQRPTTWSQ